MEINVFEDRKVKIKGIEGTQNENNIQQLEINVPEEYKEFNKKIVFITKDGIVWDFIEENTYTIRKNISKYRYVSFYIWLTKDDNDFRSETNILNFNSNKDASNEISEEEQGAVNKVINLLEEEITKVTELEARLMLLIDDIQLKLEKGEFNGQDYILTEEDKEEISEETKTLVETDIQPTLNDVTNVSNNAMQLAEHAEVIARGRATGYVFNTLEDLEEWLLDSKNVSKLVLGDNFYIRATNVPDYWWDGNQKQQLEAEKPDLSNLVDKSAFVYDKETETLSITI